jgi:hypothetical protein
VDRLPEKYRAPVVLCHLEGRTHAEAARLLGCPVGTVGIRLSRARERLRTRLTRRGLALPATLVVAVLSPKAAAASMPAGLADSTVKAAMCLAARQMFTAGAVPASVAELAQGELRTMIITRRAFVAVGVLGAGSVAAGAGLLAAGERLAQDQPRGAPAPGAAIGDDRAARDKSMYNLKFFGLAMHNFLNAHGTFPPAVIRGKDGKRLLSWRVSLLPYLEQAELYNRFHLDEPWDSPHNKALLKEMPDVYAPVVKKDRPEHSTYYQVFVGPGALFEEAGGTRLADITDSTSFTLMVAEAAEAVPWTKPEDIPFDPEKPMPKLGGQFADGFHVNFADGAALFLSNKVDPATLRALITRNGGEPVSADKLLP